MLFRTFALSATPSWDITIPPDVRRKFGPECVLTKGSGCLVIHPPVHLERFMDGADDRNIRRFVAAGACTIDLTMESAELPAELAARVGLDGDPVLLCVGTHGRIVNRADWTALLGNVTDGGGAAMLADVPRDVMTQPPTDGSATVSALGEIPADIDCGQLDDLVSERLGAEGVQLLGATRLGAGCDTDMLVCARGAQGREVLHVQGQKAGRAARAGQLVEILGVVDAADDGHPASVLVASRGFIEQPEGSLLVSHIALAEPELTMLAAWLLERAGLGEP